MESILSKLKEVEDKRDKKGKIYKLCSILGLLILARLMGYNTPKSAYRLSKMLPWCLLRQLGFKDRRPCYSTITTSLQKVDILSLEKVFREISSQLCSKTAEHISIDGKSNRGSSRSDKTAEHLVNAFCAEINGVVAQEHSARGGTEISSAKAIVKRLDLLGKVVTGDAMFCQSDLCEKIVEKQGDYVFSVKDNQKYLLANIKRSFVDNEFDLKIKKYSEDPSKSHGRIEQRSIEVMDMPYEFGNGFDTVAQIGRITRYVIRNGKETNETAYIITSLKEASAKKLLEYNRNHWGVENKLHWCKDVIFNEDRSTITNKNAVYVNNYITNITLSLGKKVSNSVTEAIEICSFNAKKALKLIT